MQRRAWFEIHDHRLFPRFLRDMQTDILQAIWNNQNIYAPVVPRLRQALRAADANRIVDLCSGGGGPWLKLSRTFAKEGNSPEICLTDIYPNLGAFERLRRETPVDFCPDPVNAMRIPPELRGFRTLFTSFHHFDPRQARAILKDAFDARQGIGIFESSIREARTLLGVFLLPLLILLLVPGIRPFRWSLLFYSYLVPIIPFVVWLDGVLSCLRSYSQKDLAELIAGLEAEDYRWSVGIERGPLVSVAYLIGHPLKGGVGEPAVEEAEIEKAAYS
jgi:hypothetical protein